MLTLKLTHNDGQVTVHANEAQSHSFSLHDLRLNDAELKAFVHDPRPYGSRLFQALFKDGSAAKTAFAELSKQSARTIVLVLESSALDSVAWEYAYNENKQEYVVEDYAFMRALPESERPANGRLKGSVERVSLLFIPANPLIGLSGEPMSALDVDSEWREMTRHIIASHAPFDLLQLRPATPEQLQTVMANFRDRLIVHFSGHGATKNDGAILLFEEENGAAREHVASEFIRDIKDKASIAFMSSCQSAAPGKTEFSNLARKLVKAGVPFALGMQFNLPDKYDDIVSKQFYNYLARGHTVPEATLQARRAIKREAVKSEEEFYIGLIALYAAHPNEVGKLEWSGSGARTLSTFAEADVSDLPTPSGFIGRQRELMNIGTSLLQKKKPNTVTLHGAGGIGKTALMRQALLRFAPSFELTLAIALDPLPSLESVLGRLERFLNLPSPCSNDTKEREQIVRGKLASKETLLGLDNFETLNYALNEKDSDEEKIAKSLHAFFKYLAANGVTICVTSREVTSLPGETIEDIQGLSNESGGRLFQENVVRQKNEIYIDKTRQVSEMVGGHPLALRLLASTFDDQVGTTLDQYIENLQSFLPKARDKWTKEDRHETLRASFDFTMKNLVRTNEGTELQIALSRLSVFTAFFSPMLVAPVIYNKWPETNEEIQIQHENADMIPRALWERGLLERVSILWKGENYHLYRLHPVLGIFAKEQLTSTEIIQENYSMVMSRFADIAEEQVRKNSLIAQITLRSMPDLLIAAESGTDEESALMRFRISKTLEQFGHYDESLRLSEEACKIYESLNMPKEKALILGAMTRIYVTRGDLDKSWELLAVLRDIGDKQEGSAALFNMARILLLRGDLERAMQLYRQAFELIHGMGDAYSEAAILHQIATIHMMSGELDEAIKLCQKTLAAFNELGDLKSKSDTLSLMADIFVKRGDLDMAMMFYKQSLEISESIGNLKGKANTIGAMGGVYFYRRDLNKALKMLEQKLAIIEQLGDKHEKAITLVNIGVALSLQNKDEDALMAMLTALDDFISLDAKLQIEQTVGLLKEFQQRLGVQVFMQIWKQATGSSSLPEWLSQPPQ